MTHPLTTQIIDELKKITPREAITNDCGYLTINTGGRRYIDLDDWLDEQIDKYGRDKLCNELNQFFAQGSEIGSLERELKNRAKFETDPETGEKSLLREPFKFEEDDSTIFYDEMKNALKNIEGKTKMKPTTKQEFESQMYHWANNQSLNPFYELAGFDSHEEMLDFIITHYSPDNKNSDNQFLTSGYLKHDPTERRLFISKDEKELRDILDQLRWDKELEVGMIPPPVKVEVSREIAIKINNQNQ